MQAPLSRHQRRFPNRFVLHPNL